MASQGDDEVFTGGAKGTGDPGTIVAHNVTTGGTRELYRPEQGSVFDFSASPSGTLVAVLRQIFEVDVPAKDATVKLGNGYICSNSRTASLPKCYE